MFANVIFTLHCGSMVLLPPADVQISIIFAVKAAQIIKVDVIYCVFFFIEELGSDVALFDEFAQRGGRPIIFWAGGFVLRGAGDFISTRFKLFNTCGSIEVGIWPVFRATGDWDLSVWAGMCFYPAVGIQFR